MIYHYDSKTDQPLRITADTPVEAYALRIVQEMITQATSAVKRETQTTGKVYLSLETPRDEELRKPLLTLEFRVRITEE